jgi:hypothetical protein
LIIENTVVATTDTYISSASPSTNYRTGDLSISTVSTTNKAVAQFSVPSSIDPSTIVSAHILLNVKTLSGSNVNYSISSALLAGSIDYRFISWTNYASGLLWTTAGGDILSNDSITTTTNLAHTVNSRVIVDCTNAILYTYRVAASYTPSIALWTSASNVNTVYYSFETADNGPVLVITQKQPHTGDRMGRNTSVISVPSV